MKQIVKDYGEYIREHRIRTCRSQGEIAEMLGISQAAYSRYELGKREPGLDLIIKFSKIFGFRPGDFFNNYK